MTASRRLAAPQSRVDQELADWLSAKGHPCPPSRVAGWRRAGLLPAPSGSAPRVGRHPGRAPLAWTDRELADAQVLSLRLVDATGRGKSNTDAALGLAGEGMPVPPEAVLTAARAHMAQLDRTIRAHLGLPVGTQVALHGESSRVTGVVEEVVDEVVRANPKLMRAIARRLRDAPANDSDADAGSVLTLVVAAVAGQAPDPRDTDALALTLRAIDAYGLTEPAGGPGGPRILAGGPADAAFAIGRFGLPQLQQLLEDLRPQDVHPSLRATRQLGRALAGVPDSVGHYVAAKHVAALLLDNGPTAVVLRLAAWQALRYDHEREPDIAPIVDAVRAQGWLTQGD